MLWFIRSLIKGMAHRFGYEISAVKKETIVTNKVMINPLFSKIHYGCAGRILDQWLNVDLNLDHTQNNIAIVNLVKRHPFHDNTFKYGYAEDFLEHLQQSDQIIFLSEVFRTFKRKGVLRISSPSLEGVLKKHYPDNTYETVIKAKEEAYDMWGHIHFYSFKELELICRNIGFSKIEKVKYNMSKYTEFENIDSRIEQKGLNMIIEITK